MQQLTQMSEIRKMLLDVLMTPDRSLSTPSAGLTKSQLDSSLLNLFLEDLTESRGLHTTQVAARSILVCLR